MVDPLVARLRSAGCVFAEEEAAEIRRVLGHDEADTNAVVAARASGVPLEQALGRARFGGIEVELADGVFVPRMRAERIVDAAVASAPSARVALDLGAGSGAIAAAMASRLPAAEVHAVELEPAAVAVLRRNAAAFGFTAHAGDWWSALPATLLGRIDLVAAYLPHVPRRELGFIPSDFREHEPVLAVDGGEDGLDPLRAVLPGLHTWLAPAGTFVTLVAGDQRDAARDLARPVREILTADGDVVLVLGRVE